MNPDICMSPQSRRPRPFPPGEDGPAGTGDWRCPVPRRGLELHCIALQCIELHCMAMHCTALQCIAGPPPQPQGEAEGQSQPQREAEGSPQKLPPRGEVRESEKRGLGTHTYIQCTKMTHDDESSSTAHAAKSDPPAFLPSAVPDPLTASFGE